MQNRERPLDTRMTDADIDRLLSTPVPGGSQARDWFLPHDTERGLANVREVVRRIITAADDIRARHGARSEARSETITFPAHAQRDL